MPARLSYIDNGGLNLMRPDHFRERLGDKTGEAFQTDRAFRQRRRQAETISLRMAARWGAVWLALLVACALWPR